MKKIVGWALILLFAFGAAFVIRPALLYADDCDPAGVDVPIPPPPPPVSPK